MKENDNVYSKGWGMCERGMEMEDSGWTREVGETTGTVRLAGNCQTVKLLFVTLMLINNLVFLATRDRETTM